MTYEHWTTVGLLIKRYFCRVFSLELIPTFMYRLNEFFFSVTEWWLNFVRFIYFLYNSATIEEVTLEEWRGSDFWRRVRSGFQGNKVELIFFFLSSGSSRGIGIPIMRSLMLKINSNLQSMILSLDSTSLFLEEEYNLIPAVKGGGNWTNSWNRS